MRKLILSLLLVGGVAFAAISASTAFFSDSETSVANRLEAGALDLKIDNTCYYNGKACENGYWGGDPQVPINECSCTWEASDLDGKLFFDLRDLKPGDWEEDTISFEVENDAWVCADITTTANDDNGFTEPEDNEDGTPENDADGTPEGDLAGELHFIFWRDDGDNVLETDEEASIFINGLADELLLDAQWAVADASTGGPLPGGVTGYIGKGFCYGEIGILPVAPGDNSPLTDPGFTCDGTAVTNISQTDILMADISFSAVQARHNPDYYCTDVRTTPTPTPTSGTTPTPTPTPLACGQADVMLVLDRSGSINSTELANLKTAANSFVTALGLSTTGVHAGMSSFANTGTLNQVLTDSGPTVIAAINALTSGGFTNLLEGLNLATGELSGVNDRADGTSPDYLIVVTDGNPNRPLPSNTADDLALAAANTAKGGGTQIFVVGVGGDVNAAYLTSVASPGQYYSVADYSGLEALLENLDLCNGVEG